MIPTKYITTQWDIQKKHTKIERLESDTIHRQIMCFLESVDQKGNMINGK